MGQEPERKSPEELKREIDEAREALGEKVDELTGRFRESAQDAKEKGIKVGVIALGVVVAAFVIRKLIRR